MDRSGTNRFRQQSNSTSSYMRLNNNESFHRLNPSSGPNPSTLSSMSSRDDSSAKPICQICTKVGHIAKLCYRRYGNDQEWKPQPRYKAYTAKLNSSTQGSNEWIIDSDANNHVTSDINNLSSFFAYNGPDKL
jgi:hypothetical protein